MYWPFELCLLLRVFKNNFHGIPKDFNSARCKRQKSLNILVVVAEMSLRLRRTKHNERHWRLWRENGSAQCAITAWLKRGKEQNALHRKFLLHAEHVLSIEQLLDSDSFLAYLWWWWSVHRKRHIQISQKHHFFRSCENAQDQDACPGESVQREACAMGRCPSWGSWSPYGDCSASCGGGMSYSTNL